MYVLNMKLLLVFSLILVVRETNGFNLPPMAPFFFLCNYHGNVQEMGVERGEVALSVTVKGDPEFYIPGQFYEITVTSSMNFNGFFLTGLYSISNKAMGMYAQPGVQGNQPVGQNLMCSIVHSHMNYLPTHELSFVWIAPSAGMGCVSFLATANLQQQLLFKDTVVLQLCEEGDASKTPLRPDLAELHSELVILRDDFDSSPTFRQDLWKVTRGGEVSDKCGVVLHGNSAVFCEKEGQRQLITVPLNTTSSKILQFAVSAGSCGRRDSQDKDIVVSYSIDGCQNFIEIEKVRPPTTSATEVHMVHLPSEARGQGICIQWRQLPNQVRRLPEIPEVLAQDEPYNDNPWSQNFTNYNTTYPYNYDDDKETTTPAIDLDRPLNYDNAKYYGGAKSKKGGKYPTAPPSLPSPAPRRLDKPNDPRPSQDDPSGSYKSCWAIDNILIVNIAEPPKLLIDDFDPVDPSNWLFFPGANIQQNCHSDENAIYFTDKNQTFNYMVTRDLDLSPYEFDEDSLLTEDFEFKQQPGWEIRGGHVDVTCGEIGTGNSMVFDADGKRLACSPYMDTTEAGNLRFYLGIGSGSCNPPGSKKASILVYLEDEAGQTQVLQKLETERYLEPQLVSMEISPFKNGPRARICWIQKTHRGAGRDVWAIDKVTVLPTIPTEMSPNRNQVIQFKINLQCGINTQKNSLQLEVSTNHGLDWVPLFSPCLPSACHGDYLPFDSVYSSHEQNGWERITLPLPYLVQTPFVRFRFMQPADDPQPNWAVDDVFIGNCLYGCHGHGFCHQEGCDCDFGYKGTYCEESVVPNPSTFQEHFENPDIVESSGLVVIEGGTIGYDCGVVASGKALVFNGDGLRQIVTTDFNTTDSLYLQFSIRVGSVSMTSKCPAPSSPMESVVLEFTCSGGVHWEFLREFSAKDFKQPMMDSVSLPDSAKRESCKFRWRQMSHSGRGQDVWAIDDVSLSKKMNNMLDVNAADMKDMREDLTAHLGKLVDSYCGAPKSITFAGNTKVNESRYLMTESLNIGPSQMIQFDLTMGCGTPYTKGIDNQLYLEYSTDHGISWGLVEKPCLPPDICNTYHSGTLYHYSQYPEWTKINVLLPPDTWSPHTRFRWIQPEWGPTDAWAIKRFYIGQQCPDMCNGQGACEHGLCKCDDGFVSKNCQSDSPMESVIHADFGMRYEPEKDFRKITGGDVVKITEGCGIILSGESMYFYKDGVRELVTKDLDTTSDDFIQFYIRIGGGDKHCTGGEKRGESVLLQYSNDGGINWNLLEELHHTDYRAPRFVHLDLADTSKTPSTRFRWWQPSNSGEYRDQWAVDEIYIGPNERLPQLEDDFDNNPDPFESGNWLMVTEGVNGKYCQSGMPAMVLGNQLNDKYAVTKDLQLNTDDVIQFKINVGCGSRFRWDYPVMLQYSQDGGRTWHLVQEPCYQQQDCDGDYTEGSIYYPGTHGAWTLIVIPVPEKIAQHPSLFRWWQPGDMTHSFALDDVYIGSPCDDNCNRNGVCKSHQCQCDENLYGPECQSDEPRPMGMLDRFDNRNQPTAYWNKILGGYLGRGCGIVDFGNSLYFNGPGTREAKTDALDTTNLRMIQFVVKIGGERNQNGCRQPENRNEGVIVDYSTDNEITWNILKVIEPKIYNTTTQVVQVQLPKDAKTNHTIFRWWQPLGHGGMPRAEWAIDSVLIGVNDTNTVGFQDNFNMMMPDPHTWFLADSAVPRITCNSKGNALEFSSNTGLRYAETWDYHVTPSTFLQFEIAMGCGSLYGTLYSVMLEYSVNMGKTWHPVISECMPPNFECSGYHLSSEYSSDQHMNWTRVTVYLPPGAVSPATRFRWLQHTSHPRGTVWALDNVYLGEGCPWMCSGHGYCDEGKCICDPGFEGTLCVPSEPLPMSLKDDFQSDEPDRSKWREIYGGENTDICGHLVNGNSLTFHKDALRMAVTKDIDTSMLTTIEFHFRYGCDGKQFDWPRTHSVLLQYSSNGGITWKLLQELHYRNESGNRFFSLALPMLARMNATRFRFWQPMNDGEMQTTWSIDNLFIGTMPMNPSMLLDDFDNGENPDNWMFINGGKTGEYCQFNTGPTTNTSGLSSLVFRHTGSGEKSVETRDLNIGPMSVLQFDINVGCGAEPTDKYPVRLEYTADGGKTWQLLVMNCAEFSEARCFHSRLPATIYYGGTTADWRRVIVPIDSIHLCGSVRFRWHQGIIPEYDFGPEWAVDNIYIGMSCLSHCNGHGRCNENMMCDCDDGYSGMTCIPYESNPTYLKEDFNQPVLLPFSHRGDLPVGPLNDEPVKLNKDRWSVWSGVDVSTDCGVIFTGPSLFFDNKGERSLTTKELDLTKVSSVEFYLQQGCHHPTFPASPVFLQYTADGGVHWNTIEQFDFHIHGHRPKYIALHLPTPARTNSTQIRWWQPSVDGIYDDSWSIDQIYIGGDIYGDKLQQDQPTEPDDSTWLMYPGGVVEPVCQSDVNALHFKEKEKMRYAISSDVSLVEGSYLQFDLAMGCDKPEHCFSIYLQFSFDMGKTWSLLQPACIPSNIDCSSYFTSSIYQSDVYNNWNRITMVIPYYARSKSTRFRWLQPDDFNPSDTWALSHLYIGTECSKMCNGRGRCSNSTCVCDDNWEGEDCSQPVSPLLQILVEDFTDATDPDNWLKVVGGEVASPCYYVAAGKALHFTGSCNRLLMTRDLDLRDSKFIQFYFMFGCNASPVSRNESVLLDYSTDAGITWLPITELYFNLYSSPSFISIKIPKAAKKNGVRIRWWQPENQGKLLSDWLLDSVRINGEEINPTLFKSNITDKLDPKDFVTVDNLHAGEYCNEENAIVGTTKNGESSVLITREITLDTGYMLQFLLNVGCGQPRNVSASPVHLQYSTDHGLTWSYLKPQCLPNDPRCNKGPSMPSIFYSTPDPGWQRISLTLEGLPLSNATRFRWTQPFGASPKPSTWAIKDIYIGPACPNYCNGHGYCDYPTCICDEAYGNEACQSIFGENNPTQLKDMFDEPNVNRSKWSVVQAGDIGDPCNILVQDTALVFNGPGIRQAVTVDLDLRDARFVQYTGQIGGQSQVTGCFLPNTRDQSVILQFSTDGGISWQPLHTLDYTNYLTPKQDYIHLPDIARTYSTRIRWWQPLSINPTADRPTWSLDNVFIGGTDINPSTFQTSFNESIPQDDGGNWEFSPFGEKSDTVCSRQDDVVSWKEGKGSRHFTTNQLIVQTGYMLQFKIVVGCNKVYNICEDHSPIRLEYNRNPSSDKWDLVRTLCVPDSNNEMECRPQHQHEASTYNIGSHPSWTRITMELPDKVYSASTRFRWLQDSPVKAAPGFALDDIYVGESCPEMCNGRGDCSYGNCVCDENYYGPSCLPIGSRLPHRMFESFEGGIFPSYWLKISGGGIGFGCGALLPYAHGKTLYFNDCGIRQAVTAEMNLQSASKIIFVLQIGCNAQTSNCNVKIGDGPDYRGVLLQYTTNKGADWKLLARHNPDQFLRPKRMAYDIPDEAKKVGVQFRWWQPVHDGKGFDQWAIDHIEIVPGRKRHRKRYRKG
ncbi:reelin isoform X2 [Patella vulgata]|uniref:reelin isoform X2 n=1 Tax=Patella vulgata TaxID=6465 RepID=UPI0024A8CBDA|nr:reelin isoform X2 [Patella vulgata]